MLHGTVLENLVMQGIEIQKLRIQLDTHIPPHRIVKS